MGLQALGRVESPEPGAALQGEQEIPEPLVTLLDPRLSGVGRPQPDNPFRARDGATLVGIKALKNLVVPTMGFDEFVLRVWGLRCPLRRQARVWAWVWAWAWARARVRGGGRFGGRPSAAPRLCPSSLR